MNYYSRSPSDGQFDREPRNSHQRTDFTISGDASNRKLSTFRSSVRSEFYYTSLGISGPRTADSDPQQSIRETQQRSSRCENVDLRLFVVNKNECTCRI